MGWRDILKKEEPKTLPEMTTIYDAKTQSVKLILWADYVGKGHQAYDFSQRARRRRTSAFKRPAVAENQLLPDDVEGCDIASPFRDFMAESLKESNDRVRAEMQNTVDTLKTDMEVLKRSQAETEAENRDLKKKLAESESYIRSLTEDMQQVQKATWENRNFRIEMKDKIKMVESHLQKSTGFEAATPKEKKHPIPDYTVVYNPKTRQAELMLLGAYLNTPNRPTPKQEWASIYDDKRQSVKLLFWRDYVKYHEPGFLKIRRENQIRDLERKFDKDTLHAPLSVRNKIAMIKFWLKTIDLPEEDDFKLAFERARDLFEKGGKVGVEVPKAIHETLLEVDLEMVWKHQTPDVQFEGNFSFLKELRKRLQSDSKDFPKLPIRNYVKKIKPKSKPKIEEQAPQAVEAPKAKETLKTVAAPKAVPKVVTPKIDTTIVESTKTLVSSNSVEIKKEAPKAEAAPKSVEAPKVSTPTPARKKSAPIRSQFNANSFPSSSAGMDMDPFTSMMLSM